MSEPRLLTGWLAGKLCCQPHFQFHEVKAVKIRGEIVNEAARRPSPLDQPKQWSRERWMDGIPLF